MPNQQASNEVWRTSLAVKFFKKATQLSSGIWAPFENFSFGLIPGHFIKNFKAGKILFKTFGIHLRDKVLAWKVSHKRFKDSFVSSSFFGTLNVKDKPKDPRFSGQCGRLQS